MVNIVNDTQILDWIEENLERLHENAHGKLEMVYLLPNGGRNVVVAENLRECIKLAVEYELGTVKQN
jgi:hypothetical protein